MEDNGGFSLERLTKCGAAAGHLSAHPTRVCLLARGGGLVVCSGDGALEVTSDKNSRQVESACWSPCGHFLALGEASGQLSLFHVPCQLDAWSVQAAGVSPSHDNEPGGAACVFSEMRFVEGPTASLLGLLVLLASGVLLHVSHLQLADLDGELRTAMKEGTNVQKALVAFQHRLQSTSHELGDGMRHFCASARGVGPRLRVYAYSVAGVSVYELAGGACKPQDVAELPDISVDLEFGALDRPKSYKAPFSHDTGDLELSPMKRRRLSGEMQLSGQEPPALVCFSLCPVSAQMEAAGASSGGTKCVDAFDTLLISVYRCPGLLVLYDANLLFEVFRWSAPSGKGIFAAQCVNLPACSAPGNSVLEGRTVGLDDQGAEQKRQPTPSTSVTMAMVLETGEFLVCTFPDQQMLFSAPLDGCARAQGLRAVLLAAPSCTCGPSQAATGQAALAFVAVVGGTGSSGERAEAAETAVSVLRFCAEEDALDRSVDLDDDTEDGGNLEGRSTASLRHQLELFMERAAQGKLQLQAAVVLRLVQQLAGQIPGFVVGSVLHAYFADVGEMRGALQGTLQLLQREGLPASYDLGKGIALLTDALARLATFEHLHGALGTYAVEEPPAPSGAPQSVRPGEPPQDASLHGQGPGSPRRGSASGVLPPARPRSVSGGGTARRRHSLPSFRETQMLAERGRPGQRVVELLARLGDLEGPEFCAVWQHFRCVELPQVCFELVAAGWLVEAFTVFSRHGSKFSSEDVMALIESLPAELGREQEERLPLWLAREALPLLSGNRGRLLRWLAGRAQLLELQRRSPETALQLLGTVLSAAVPDAMHAGELPGFERAQLADGAIGEGELRFPGARVARDAFWSGAPLLSSALAWSIGTAQPRPHRPHHDPGADGAAGLLELFQQLQCCAHISKLHGLKVSLLELREPHATRHIAARLLDRALAPDLLGDEVSTHVAPFCRWRGMNPDEVMEAYVLELAESLHLPSGEVRLERAAAVLGRIEAPELRANCLVKLLERWSGSEVPEALQPLMSEEASWPPAVRASVLEQLSLLRVQRALRLYGAGVACTTHPEYAARFVQHLLHRVEGGAASLQEALAVLRVFPQRFSRAEALCLRLTHVAALVGGHAASPEELRREAAVTLDCAESADERLAAANCFSTYCNDLLGEWSGAIESNEGCRGGGAAAACVSPEVVSAWKSASTALCNLALAVLQQASVGSMAGFESNAPFDSRRRMSEAHFAMFVRLKQLQEEFDLFLDPLQLAQRASPLAVDQCGVPPDPSALELFVQHADGLLTQCLAMWSSSSADQAGGSTGPGGSSFTRLLRLGSLLGLGQLQVHQTLILEASSRGLPSACHSVISKLLHAHALGTVNLVALVQSLLRHICENKQTLRKPPELILQLTHIGETVASCMGLCTEADLAPLIELITDVQFTVEVLLSSDLLDALARIPSAWPRLQELPLVHAHHLGGLLEGRARPEGGVATVSAPLGPHIFQKSFLEIPLLIPGGTAMQVCLEYLAQTHAGLAPNLEQAGGPRPPMAVLSRLFDALQSSECVELATALLLRHQGRFPGADLCHLCRERSAVVLRAGGPIDHQLAMAYLGCLGPRDASQLLLAAMSYLRTEQHRTEHHRLQRLSRLGADLGALWGNSSVRAQMLQIETSAKWSQCLSLLDVPFDGAKFMGRMAGFQLSSSKPLEMGAATKESSATYSQSLLPRLVCAAHFDLHLALQFGRDHAIPESEVLALWVQVCLSSASPSAIGTRLLVTQVLRRLLAEGAEEALLGRVLAAVSPYDYARISLVLELVGQQPRARRQLQVLQSLHAYRRRSPASSAELRHLEELFASLVQRQPAEATAVAAEARDAATRLLPWHAIALSANPWPTLAPELSTHAALVELLPLCEPLGLDPDEFYMCFFSAWEPSADPKAAATGCPVHTLLPQIASTRKALDVARKLEDRTPLGPEKIAIAKSRLGLLQRQAGSRECGDACPATSLPELREHIGLLESRWDLLRSGLAVFDEALVRHGARACVSCLYYGLPSLLQWAGRQAPEAAPPKGVDGLAEASAGIRALGVQGLHKLVDAICARHGLTPKLVRQQLMEQWVTNMTDEFPLRPAELADAELAQLAHLSSRPMDGPIGATGDTPAGDESPGRSRLTAGADLISEQMFKQSPAELLCLDRLAVVAHPRHECGCSDVPKDAREDVRSRAIFFLRMVFTKEARMAYNAKCRALAVLFRIASLDEIAAAYRNPVEELCEIWKLYFYMDTFERLGMPQDFKRFYQCSKDGLARSLWRSHQTDPRMVQIIAAICLDFGVIDSRFWSSILACLHGLRLHGFLRDILVAMHERLVLDLPHDSALVAVMAVLFRAPLDALTEWLQSPGQSAPPSIASWLPLMPQMLRRSPFLTAFDTMALARQLLAVSQSPTLVGEGLLRLACAVFGRNPASPPAEDTGGVAEQELRDRFGGLALELAMCSPTPARLEDFMREDIAAQHPRLIFVCLQKCSGIPRSILFEGILENHLVAESRACLDSATFGDFVEYAVATRDIQELLEGALQQGQLEGARRLLVLFARVHHIPSLGTVVDRAEVSEGELATKPGDTAVASVAYLAGVLNRLRTAEATSQAYSDFAKHMSGKAT